jgi:hypothetical protein
MTTTKAATLALGLALAAFSARPAKAGIVVGTCAAGTQYKTVQDAVNAAPSGSVIKVCPGAYPEQVLISEPLTLEGVTAKGDGSVVVLPPATGFVQNDSAGYAAQILVLNTTNVTLANLTVDGVNNSTTCMTTTGILLHNASGTVNKVSVRNQIFPQASPHICDGLGFVALNEVTTPQTVTVENSDFRNQSLFGIEATGNDLSMNTTNNYVAGPDNSQLSTSGIVYLFGPSGSIQGNTVVNEVYPLPQTTQPLNNSYGIAVACSTASVSNNLVSQTQLGIYMGCPLSKTYASKTTVTLNQVFDTSVGHGIYVNTSGNSITNNTVVGSGSAGILLDSAAGGTNNTVTGNTLTEACIGIVSNGGNSISNNSFNALYIPTQKSSCGPVF